MTRKLCSHCGTSSADEARFCRRCGVSLRYASATDAFVSPLAATLPLPSADTHNLDDTSSTATHDLRLPATTARAEVASADNTPTFVASDPLMSAAPTATLTGLTTSVSREELPGAFDSAGGETQTLVNTRFRAAESMKTSARQGSNGRVWLWWLAASTIVAAVAALLTISALNSIYQPRKIERDVGEQASASALDAPSESLRLMAEAERLLAAGAPDKAIERLREAVRLDDRNARAQLQLGATLDGIGRRDEAIVFYEAAAALMPEDATAWRLLGEAQFAENRFPEAARSYHRFIELAERTPAISSSEGDDLIRLRFATALHRTGEHEQARALYARLAAAGSTASVKSTAQAQLAILDGEQHAAKEEHAAADVEPSGTSESEDAPREVQRRETLLTAKPATTGVLSTVPTDSTRSVNGSVVPPPAPRLTPQERFARAVSIYAADRRTALAELRAVADSVPDAHYYLGLARTEGQTPRTMHRAELLAALKHFQTASRPGGRYAAQATRYAEQLGREYDRRLKE